jgi:hypothetical protein
MVDMPLARGSMKLRIFLGCGVPWLWLGEAHFWARLYFAGIFRTLTTYS